MACTLNPVPVMVCGGWVGRRACECLCMKEDWFLLAGPKGGGSKQLGRLAPPPLAVHHGHRRHRAHSMPQPVCVQSEGAWSVCG